MDPAPKVGDSVRAQYLARTPDRVYELYSRAFVLDLLLLSPTAGFVVWVIVRARRRWRRDTEDRAPQDTYD